ncbi:MAG: phenylalanine--tRNA ligase subunit alpha, partial [Planctomycetota bacterium]
LAELAEADTSKAVEAWRIRFLGSKGLLKAAMGGMKDVAPADKPAVGKKANDVKSALEASFADRQKGAPASGARGPRLDVTEPGVVQSEAVGRRHIISRVRDELVEVCARLGFSVAHGPELEDDEHNFIKLNIPAEHPARDPIDNFYVDDPLQSSSPPRMLRSQTSTVQIRVMEQAAKDGSGPPIKVVSPGRVYRPDTVDATHSFMFHQLEALWIDRDITMSHLKTTLFQFARAYFGEDAQIRLRPSYFPFTEPSAEFDMKIRLRPDKPAEWIELGGCGMVDPAVLDACGIDPEQWTGFAWGMGIERLAMGKYGIPDIRWLYENDLRFLQQL